MIRIPSEIILGTILDLSSVLQAVRTSGFRVGDIRDYCILKHPSSESLVACVFSNPTHYSDILGVNMAIELRILSGRKKINNLYMQVLRTLSEHLPDLVCREHYALVEYPSKVYCLSHLLKNSKEK